MKKSIQPKAAAAAIGPYSPAVKVGDLLMCSGQIAIDPTTGGLVVGDVVAQTEQAMRNLSALLEAADLNANHVVKTTIFMTDLGDFAKVNEAYGKYFAASPPARSTVQVAALPKGALVMIEAIAHTGA